MSLDKHEIAKDLSKLHPDVKLGSQIEPMKSRCRFCDRSVDAGEVNEEGRCEKCASRAEGSDLSQSTLRRLAFERDKGRCFRCREDTEAHRKEIEQMREWAKSDDQRQAHFGKNRLAYYRGHVGYSQDQLEGKRSLWDLHHINEKALGGQNTLANAATTCTPCHESLTSGFNKARAKDRKGSRGPWGRRR